MDRNRALRGTPKTRLRPQRVKIEPPPGFDGVDGALWALKVFTDQVHSLVDDAEKILREAARNHERDFQCDAERLRSRRVARPQRRRLA